jgi:two-component system, sensor histidine kinase LadS
MRLEKGAKATVLIRLQSTAALIVPMNLWERDAYKTERLAHNFLMGLLFGVLAIMLIYNASLYVFTRDNSYLAYSVYLATAALYELAITGYGPLYVWGDHFWMTWRGYEFTACLAFLSATVFFRVFLELRTCKIRHLVWMNNGFVTFWALAAVLTVLQNSPLVSLLIALGGLVGGVAAVYSSIYRIFQGSISARYFAIAWSTLLVGTTVHILSLFGAIEGNWVTDYGQHMGFVVEIMLLSLALADRIKRERAARERAQEETLALTRKVQLEREEKIRAQEQAIEIQTRAKEELELRVLDRTAELERAMKNLEIANVELAKLSVTDALTKVHNRRYFDDVLKREHDRSSRTGVPLALALVDIDHFKKINDSWPATSACAWWPPPWRTPWAARPTWWRATAARNSRWCCRARASSRPPRWPNACARRSKASTSSTAASACPSA